MKEKRKVKISKEAEQFDSDNELWDSKQLGASARHARRSSAESDKALDDALGLTPISLRLQKDLVAQLKTLSKREGLGYQTYIRQVLTRHVRDAIARAAKRESA